MAKLCPKGKAAAKRKFKVYPSARMQTCTHQVYVLVKLHQVVKKGSRKKAAGGGFMARRLNGYG
jgi:hypothetical protein